MKNLLRIKTCRVTALCDRVEALVGQAYREAGDPDIACYTDYEEMLAKADIDAVAIVTAPHDQPDLICRAMEAGKHATCEVSLTYNMEDLWRVVVAVERSGLKFQMAEQVMYHAFVNAWRKLVVEGKLGHVIFAEGQYLHGMTPDRFWVDSETGERIHLDEAANHPRAVKSRMWNWYPHPILYMATDLGPILSVLEDRVTRVTCMGTRPHSYYYEGIPASDIQVALMHTEKDTIIRMAAGFTYATTPRDHHWWHLRGPQGRWRPPDPRRSTADLGAWIRRRCGWRVPEKRICGRWNGSIPRTSFPRRPGEAGMEIWTILRCRLFWTRS